MMHGQPSIKTNYLSCKNTFVHNKTYLFYMCSLLQTKQAMYVQHNIDVRSCNHCCSGKAIGITQPECVCLQPQVSSMQCVLSSVACSSLLYFSAVSHKRHNLRQENIEHKMYFFIFSTTFLSVKFLILRRTELGVTKNLYQSSFNPQATNVIYIWSTHS